MADTMPAAADVSRKHPSVNLAYDIALKAYEQAESRLDSADDRAQTLLGFAATLTPLAAAGGKALGLNIRSGWLIAALAAFLVGIGLGVTARLYGKLKVLAPEVLFEKYLDMEPDDFKTELVYWAGKHFEENRALVNLKGRLTNLAAISLFGEAALLVAWAVRGT
jgi:hypothetical protein